MIETYLQENIDSQAAVTTWASNEWFPAALLAKYTFARLAVLGRTCVLIQPTGQIGHVNTLQHEAAYISQLARCPVVFHFTSMSRHIRKRLIEERVPFLVENGQLYLPFVSLDVGPDDHFAKSWAARFSPSSQVVYLDLLYHPVADIDIEYLAARMDMAPITASRALNDLLGKELLVCRQAGRTGRHKIYSLIDAREYLARGRAWLRSPVQRTVFVAQLPSTRSYPFSGSSALASMAMMSHPAHHVRAISLADYKKIEDKLPVLNEPVFDQDILELQVWCYPPDRFRQDDHVDVLSAALSMPALDQRLERTIESYLQRQLYLIGR